jgi:hypothetical protein
MGAEPVLPPDPGPQFSDGAWAVLAALARGAGPEELAAASRFAAEDFGARMGCYPWEMRECCPECPEDAPDPDNCPIWLPMREALKAEWDADTPGMPVRMRLAAEHSVVDDPCAVCGGRCDIFYCYGGS